jgi:hypothetical protein
MVAHLPVDIPSLNSQALTPARDETGSGLLADSALQLCPHTLLVLDESSLCPGQLTDRGVSNLQALAQLHGSQTVSYGFGCYALTFATDTPALIVARGKPLIPTALQTVGAPPVLLPIAELTASAAQAEACVLAAAASVPGGLNAMRAYLTLAAEAQASLSEALALEAQEAFVSARQADPSVGAETLHCWCTLARLLAQSQLAAAVSSEHWQRMLALEGERTARLRAREGQARGGGVLV